MTKAAEDIYLSYHDKVSAYIRGKVDHHQDAENPGGICRDCRKNTLLQTGIPDMNRTSR